MQPGNDPRQLEATPVEMVMAYYIRYLDWTNNNIAPSPTEESPPQSDREDRVSEREHTPRRSPSSTGELYATGSSSHISSHMLGDKHAGHTKEKKRSKNPLRGLARVVKKLAAQVNLVSEKIDRWDPKFKPQEFSHKEMPETEADDTFFHGMEHQNETPITRGYEKSPTAVVDLADITVGPIKTPRPKRHKKASKYIISPNVQVYNIKIIIFVVYKLINFDCYRLLQHLGKIKKEQKKRLLLEYRKEKNRTMKKQKK